MPAALFWEPVKGLHFALGLLEEPNKNQTRKEPNKNEDLGRRTQAPLGVSTILGEVFGPEAVQLL